MTRSKPFGYNQPAIGSVLALSKADVESYCRTGYENLEVSSANMTKRYILVYNDSGATITKNKFVVMAPTKYDTTHVFCAQLAIVGANMLNFIGVAPTSIPDKNLGWVQISGSCLVTAGAAGVANAAFVKSDANGDALLDHATVPTLIGIGYATGAIVGAADGEVILLGR